AARGLDDDLEHGGLTGREAQLVERAGGAEAARLGVHAHARAVGDVVDAAVREDELIAGVLRGEQRAAAGAARAADLEHVGEVGGEAQLEPQIDGVAQVVGEDELLDQRAVEELLAAQVEEVLRIVEEAAELAVGERQIDL